MPGDLPVYDFDHVHTCSPVELRQRLGGKGAGLVEMRQQLKLPVPPGFVLGTDLCRRFLTSGWPAGLEDAINAKLAALEQATGQRFGDRARPLLVSVRSGAPVSMPGMMDTILNLGANAETIAALAARTLDERFALDTWSRFCRMYAVTVLGVAAEALGRPPSDASADSLRVDIEMVRSLCDRNGTPIPDNPLQQLRGAVAAVFRSSRSERARVYREREGLSDDIPTAVVIQAMVFGNMGLSSGTGVAFTRNPSTGANESYGDFLVDAQGEDVVAGLRTSAPLSDMQRHVPAAFDELAEILTRLERHYRDLCDVEFTVQEGRLHILQVRQGKRSAMAAARIAVALAEEGLITRDEAVQRMTPRQFHQLRSAARVHRGVTPTARGVAASPGVVSGIICLDPERVAALAETGQRVILVRPTTSPEDVGGMVHAAGIVTSTGGMVSHAALVARGWGIAAVCGVESLTFGPLALAGSALREGDTITIDGGEGTIYLGDHLEPGHHEPSELQTLRQWAAELGIELGSAATHASSTVAPGDSTDASEPDAFAIIRTLSLLGFAKRDRIATVFLTTTERVNELLAALPSGHVAEAPRGLHVTPEGRGWLVRQLDAERARTDRVAADRAYRRFMAFDAAFKQLVTDWQVRVVDGKGTVNDHADSAYDAAVRGRLADLHDEVRPFANEIGLLVSRLRPFEARLVRAATAIAAGDGSMIASPLKDSYHTIWFELHEELIHLSGRNRAAEEARSTLRTSDA
jgi:pyruvate,orthophosphate dikinase